MKKLFFVCLAAVLTQACLGRLPDVPTLENVQIPAVAEEEIFWNAADYQGKPVLIVFMGSGCPWCHKTMPLLNKIADKYGDQIEIVGAFVDPTPGPARDAATEEQLQTKILFNAGEVAEGFGVTGFPHAILFDKKHRAVHIWGGYSPSFVEEFDIQAKRVL
jgi:thiol-disulfide isomerase/thioredoxin